MQGEPTPRANEELRGEGALLRGCSEVEKNEANTPQLKEKDDNFEVRAEEQAPGGGKRNAEETPEKTCLFWRFLACWRRCSRVSAVVWMYFMLGLFLI